MLESLGQHARAAEVLHSIKDVTWREERALRLQSLARNLLHARRINEAWSPLRQAASAAETKQTLAGIGQLLNEAARAGQPISRAVRRVAVVGTGTLSFWAAVLKPALYAAGIWAEVFTGEFGQYQQDIVKPDSELAKFRPDVVLIAVVTGRLGSRICLRTPMRRWMPSSVTSAHCGQCARSASGLRLFNSTLKFPPLTRLAG